MKKTKIATVAVTAGLSLALIGWGVAAGADDVMGIVTRAGDASIVAVDQPDGDRTVTVAKVVAPTDAFVVIHQNNGGMPGERLGYAAVKKGETTDITIKLDGDANLTPELIAAVHADRGIRGELEFDMEDFDRSPDKPFFVDGKEVAIAFKAAEFGVPVTMDEAAVEAGDQPLGGSVTIAKATAPTDAFVVVHRAKPDGMPGERVGFAPIPAGESTGVEVKLDAKLEGTTKLIAAIHADRGEAGTLEFDMDDPVNSPDQPFFADGMEVATVFSVGPFGVKTDDASIEATDQIGAVRSITVAEVDAPAAAWIVVHEEVGGAPGARLGYALVDAGTSRDVEVKLERDMLPENVIVALHADRGTGGVLDFDMMDILGSPDQPYFVDGAEVAAVIKVRRFGYETPAGTSAIVVSPQTVTNAILRVDSATSPEPAWIVVHQDAGGMPGARVGLVAIPAGTTNGTLVQLDASQMLTDTLFVAVHADRGEPRFFEFNMMDRINSADQPWFVDGAEVATAVTIR